MESSVSPAAITHNLKTRFVGQRVIYRPRLTSTMETARQEAQRMAAEGTVVVAGEQVAGRGRLNRAWQSPRGSIAMSVILYPGIIHLSSLIMVASLAVVHAIGEVTGLRSLIKWPNDVLINDRKVAGILIENGVRGSNVDYAIIGIGINANLRISDFPELAPSATSLYDELGREVSQVDVIRQLLIEIEKLYLALPSGDSVYREWRASLVTLGKKVRVKSAETILEGIAESVSRDGSLLLRRSDGTAVEIVAGDATFHAD